MLQTRPNRLPDLPHGLLQLPVARPAVFEWGLGTGDAPSLRSRITIRGWPTATAGETSTSSATRAGVRGTRNSAGAPPWIPPPGRSSAWPW